MAGSERYLLYRILRVLLLLRSTMTSMRDLTPFDVLSGKHLVTGKLYAS